MCLCCGIVETQNFASLRQTGKHIPNTDAIFYVNGRHKNNVFQNQKKCFAFQLQIKPKKNNHKRHIP